jgi:cytochrome c-type biogenesis protein
LGLGLPFLVVGLFTTQATRLISKSATFLKYFNIVVGILLLILGILVFTNKLNVVANWFFAASLLS